MSVVVVALSKPKPGRMQDVIDAFSVVSPLVFEEKGCEFYALHKNDDLLIMVERWTTKEDLDAHAKGAAIAKLAELRGDALEEPGTVWVLDAVPFGDLPKGLIPA